MTLSRNNELGLYTPRSLLCVAYGPSDGAPTHAPVAVLSSALGRRRSVGVGRDLFPFCLVFGCQPFLLPWLSALPLPHAMKFSCFSRFLHFIESFVFCIFLVGFKFSYATLSPSRAPRVGAGARSVTGPRLPWPRDLA